MIDIAPITAEQFAEYDDGPDALRWVELVAGRIVRLEPPNPTHGRIVLNISKTISQYVHESDGSVEGYACFELGLIVSRNPDTVRCPAISYFSGGPRFVELEKRVTETKPVLVVEVASTSDRRRQLSARVKEYLKYGIRMVWVADPLEKQVHVFQDRQPSRRLGCRQTLQGGNLLPGYRTPVAIFFADMTP